MQNYELLYIIPAQFADTEVDGVREIVAKMIEQTGAKITRNESLGKIKLAYVIEKQRHGTYVLVHFDADGTQNSELDRKLRLSDEVLRHILVERNPALDKKVYTIASYVAPLSEEARELKRTVSATPVKSTVDANVPAAAESVEPSISMEELDKKLDQILDADLT